VELDLYLFTACAHVSSILDITDDKLINVHIVVPSQANISSILNFSIAFEFVENTEVFKCEICDKEYSNE
jgi:hypothetical protein